jgi:hypothetical protein
MKKFFIILILIVAWMASINAQKYAKKGVIEIAGSVGFTSETDVFDGKTDDNSTTSISFMPRAGYFVIDGLGLFIAPYFQSTSYDKESQSMFAAFFAPLYAFDLKSNVYPFIGGLIGYNTATLDDGNNEITLSGIGYGALGGIAVQIGKNALLNFGLQYLMLTTNPENWEGDRIGNNQFALEAGFSVFFGK